MNKEERKYTFRDLKNDVAKLDEKQLDEPVIWMGEERGGYIIAVDVLEEDHIMIDEEDGYSPESLVRETYTPEEIEMWETGRLPKGTPSLLTDDLK